MNTNADRYSSRRIWIAILSISLALRLIAAFYQGDSTPPAKDETSYSVLASRLSEGYGFSFANDWYPFTPAESPTAHWSFLYTAFVAAIYSIVGVHPFAVRFVGGLLGGILLPWVIYRLAKRVSQTDESTALLSAGLAAIYAYFVLFAAQLMTETFFIIALIWSLERAIALQHQVSGSEDARQSLVTAAGLGLSLGLAALLRQSILPWIFPLFGWFLWLGYKGKAIRRTIFSLTGVIVILIVLIIPVTYRNYRAYGDFLLLNSNAGYAMYSAQHPLHGTSFQEYTAAPLPQDLAPKPQNEAEWDRVLMRKGLEFIFEDPGRYLLLSLSRTADFFKFWPSDDSSLLFNLGRVFSFALFLPAMLFGLWISLQKKEKYTLLCLFIGFYTLLHLLTWAIIRYRLPIDAVLLLFAAIGLKEVYGRLSVFFDQRASFGPRNGGRSRTSN